MRKLDNNTLKTLQIKNNTDNNSYKMIASSVEF